MPCSSSHWCPHSKDLLWRMTRRSSHSRSSVMSVRARIPAVARTLLGLAFVVFGINYFLHFLPQPAQPADALAFAGALVAGKIFTIIKPIEITAGLALLGNRFVPLALTLLAPIEIGILAFHLVFEP